MGLLNYISKQFMQPKGYVGRLISNVQNYSNRQMYNSLVPLLKFDQNSKILDIGYGNGHLLELIYKKQPVELYGIDISADAKDMATQRNRSALAAHQLHLEVGDCCSLPYADNKFSAVTTINTVYFWRDTLLGLKEIRRTLAEGGSFYNVFFNKAFLDNVPFASTNYKKFETEELVQLGIDAGFSHIELKEIAKGKSYVAIYTK